MQIRNSLNNMDWQNISASLSFDHTDMHINGEQYSQAILAAETQLLTLSTDTDQEKIKKLHQQLGIYYLFYQREKELAQHHFAAFKTLTNPDDILEYAKALLYAEIAQTLDAGFTSSSTLTTLAELMAELKIKTTETHEPEKWRDIVLHEALCYQYLGLIDYRKKYFSAAKSRILKAIEIEEAYTVPLQLAESYYFNALILIEQHELATANNELIKAKKLIPHTHALTFDIMRAQCEILRQSGEYAQARELLTLIFTAQTNFFLTHQHIDTPKLLQLFGQIHEGLNEQKEAIEYYLHALEVEENFYPASSPMLKKSLHRLILATNHYFNFNWNDYTTIKPNEDKFALLTTVLKKVLPLKHALCSEATQALGQLYYKKGTYFAHCKRLPDAANDELDTASELLKYKQLAWVYAHIAFAEQQLFAKSLRENQPEAAKKHVSLAKEFITKAYQTPCLDANSQDMHEITAFLYCVSALILYEEQEIAGALSCYSEAIKRYKQLKQCDDQYARTLNQFARISAEAKEYREAASVFAELALYWKKNKDVNNPYSSRFYLQYANFLSKIDPRDLMEKPGNSWQHEKTLLLNEALFYYQQTYDVLIATEGKDSNNVQPIIKKISELTQSTNEVTSMSQTELAYQFISHADASLKEAKGAKEANSLQYKHAYHAYREAHEMILSLTRTPAQLREEEMIMLTMERARMFLKMREIQDILSRLSKKSPNAFRTFLTSPIPTKRVPREETTKTLNTELRHTH